MDIAEAEESCLTWRGGFNWLAGLNVSADGSGCDDKLRRLFTVFRSFLNLTPDLLEPIHV